MLEGQDPRAAGVRDVSGGGSAGARGRVFQLLAVLWLLVIWGQSLLPADWSGAESGRLLALVQGLLPWMTEHILRKTAHFTEYAVLGGLIFGTFARGKHAAAREALLAGLLAAMFDETIQLFVPGRSGQITDVWLDFAGFALGYFLCRGIARAKQKKSKKI